MAQIYQPLWQFVEKLTKTKAEPQHIAELQLIQGHIEALKYFADPDSYQEKIEVDFASWFEALITTLKTGWKCQHIAIQQTILIDKVLLHQALMMICFQQLFAEVQHFLNSKSILTSHA